jgi:molybdenum cofactor synthesis domain-containing protein
MSAAMVTAVCTAPEKGEQKSEVDRATAVENHGLEGDAHAGDWHRQVSVLAEADIEEMRDRGLELKPGDFGENLVVDGIDPGGLGIGSRLRVGEAELEITQIGKACHSRCAIYHQAGDCIMPRRGVFARVVRGGEIAPGAPVEIVHEVPHGTLQAAVVTVSDSAAAGEARDTAGPAVADLLEREAGAHVAWTGIVPDDQETISKTLVDLAERGLDLIATAGGTGCAERDRTPEATIAVADRLVPGLPEAMRRFSAEITPHAWLQRGVAVIRGATLIVNLPGSRKAATENLTAVLPVIGHAVDLLRGRTAHPEHAHERRL